MRFFSSFGALISALALLTAAFRGPDPGVFGRPALALVLVTALRTLPETRHRALLVVRA